MLASGAEGTEEVDGSGLKDVQVPKDDGTGCSCEAHGERGESQVGKSKGEKSVGTKRTLRRWFERVGIGGERRRRMRSRGIGARRSGYVGDLEKRANTLPPLVETAGMCGKPSFRAVGEGWISWKS